MGKRYKEKRLAETKGGEEIMNGLGYLNRMEGQRGVILCFSEFDVSGPRIFSKRNR